MTTTSKSLLAFAVVGALAGFIAFFGFSPFGKEVVQQIVGSTAGTTFQTARVASQQVVLGTTTVFSIQNTDASDRVITSALVSLKGAVSTTTSLNITCATSTVASSLQSNLNPILALTLSGGTISQFGTTTGAGNFIATSSPGITGTTTVAAGPSQNLVNPFARTWATGTYLNCQLVTGDSFNSFSAGTNGVIAFPYLAQ